MFFAKLHPLLVHFPMALFFSGTLFQLFGGIQKEETILAAGDFNIRFGIWTALIVMVVGGLALPSLTITEPLAKKFLSSHIRYAFLSFAVFLAWIALQKLRGGFWADVANYLVLIFGMVTVFLTGFFGGELVHRFGFPSQKF